METLRTSFWYREDYSSPENLDVGLDEVERHTMGFGAEERVCWAGRFRCASGDAKEVNMPLRGRAAYRPHVRRYSAEYRKDARYH
jgi:hypothetical protein